MEKLILFLLFRKLNNLGIICKSDKKKKFHYKKEFKIQKYKNVKFDYKKFYSFNSINLL